MDKQGNEFTRRDTLTIAGVIATLPMTAEAFDAAMAATVPEQGLPWANNAMRFQQVAFTEDNPGHYDPQFWLDLFKRTHSDVVCLSAGGSFAFYPSEVPLHHRAKYLGNTDMFGDMVKGSRALGMSIIARVDPHALSAKAFAAHPEWSACTEDGKPRRHWALKDAYVTCQNAGFMFDFMPKVLKEIADLYKPEAYFGNRWAGSGMCWCNTCRTQFRAATGLELPSSKTDRLDPLQRAYDAWNRQKRWEQYTAWNNAVKSSTPDSFFSPNGGMNDPNRVTIPFLAADHQGRSGQEPVWANGKNAKETRSTMGNLPCAGIFNVGVEDDNRWKDSVQDSAEIEMWVHAGMAQGYRPWMCKFNANPIDKRWVPVVDKIYAWHYKNDRYMRNMGNFARIAMVTSQQTTTYYPDPNRGAGRARGAENLIADAQNGYYQALVESRIPFELVDDRQLDVEHIGRYRVLVLPNIACLSDAQCTQLRDYVHKGGRIVATNETSLYDEWGQSRKNFGLADLFGCDFAGKIERGVLNSYLTPHSPHPLAAGLEDAPRIIGATQYVDVTPTDKSASPLTLVRSYPDLPMESVYTLEPVTNIPEVFCRNVGKGRVVYFPMDLDRTFWNVLHKDHLMVLRNAVTWAADESQPLGVEGPGLIDMAYWKQKESLTAHLVNLSNPMTMKGYYREILPLAGPFKVTMALPAGAQVKAVTLLESEKAATYQRQGDSLIVTVPTIALHEVVAVDLA